MILQVYNNIDPIKKNHDNNGLVVFLDDNVSFMKEIGWIDQSNNNNMSVEKSTNGSTSNSAVSDYNKSPMTSPTKKKSKQNLNQNFTPFDYSKADFGT
jgi:hypothetical protein